MRIDIMTNSTQASWQTDRSWQIVRADLELAHVFMPMSSFKFVALSDGSGYQVVHTNQGPYPDCFAGVTLHHAGSTQIAFEKAAARPTLPAYDSSSAKDYTTAARKMVEFLDKDPNVERLEGIIRVPCHAHGAELPDDAVPGHRAFWVKTLIHVYQFSNVVNGDHPLVVFRAPLSPFCPTNGDGTAMGVA
jgi:hypothetical protein